MIEFPSDTILFAFCLQHLNILFPFSAASHCLGIFETRQCFKEYNLAWVKNNDVLLLPSINAESGLQPSYSNVILITLQFCPSVLSLSMLNLIC